MTAELTITKTELLALKPCKPESRLHLFKSRKSVTVAQALEDGVSIRDILWVAGRLGRKDLCIEFALACAVHVEQFDKTRTAKPCNAATAIYILNPTPENLAVLRKARSDAAAAYTADAAAADAAAYTADAAAAADAAAYTADAAAYSAAYTADAAAYTADAAAYTADAAAYTADAAAARKTEVEWQEAKLIKIFGG